MSCVWRNKLQNVHFRRGLSFSPYFRDLCGAVYLVSRSLSLIGCKPNDYFKEIATYCLQMFCKLQRNGKLWRRKKDGENTFYGEMATSRTRGVVMSCLCWSGFCFFVMCCWKSKKYFASNFGKMYITVFLKEFVLTSSSKPVEITLPKCFNYFPRLCKQRWFHAIIMKTCFGVKRILVSSERRNAFLKSPNVHVHPPWNVHNNGNLFMNMDTVFC